MAHLEIERKFDIAEGDPLPGLGGLVTVGEAREHRMRAVYLDTPELLLTRHRVTLRRREGGDDAGWHLKLPDTGSGRLEIHADLDAGPGPLVPPGELRATAVQAVGEAWPQEEAAATALLPAAVLSTVRVELDLLGAEGQVLARLCDDTVTAEPSGRRWRELEVELVEGDEEFLDQVVEEFAAQGVPLSASPSKIARALGDRPGRVAAGKGARRSGPAADVLRDYLTAQVAEIVGREEQVRSDAPDAVHQARVASRRLRTALRTFRRLLHREVTDPLRDELRWYAHVLGAARDEEVMRERLVQRLDATPAHLLRGPVRDRIEQVGAQRHTSARVAVVEALDSARYRALADSLLELLAEPPWRGRARKKARRVLPPLVQQAVGRAERAWDAADDPARGGGEVGAERSELLHEARKRAKAARYAGEVLAPSFGREAAQLARAWKRVTTELGEVQDAAVAQALLMELAVEAEGAGDSSFTLGVLAGADAAMADRAESDAAAAVERALALTWPRST